MGHFTDDPVLKVNLDTQPYIVLVATHELPQEDRRRRAKEMLSDNSITTINKALKKCDLNLEQDKRWNDHQKKHLQLWRQSFNQLTSQERDDIMSRSSRWNGELEDEYLTQCMELGKDRKTFMMEQQQKGN